MTATTGLTLATDPADAEAVDQVEAHHAEMSGQLTLLVADLVGAAATGDATASRDRLATWCRRDLLPHAEAEERTIYPAGAELPALKVLVDAMVEEHRALADLVTELERSDKPVAQAAAGRAIQALFATHLAKENDHVLPALASSPDHSVATLLAGMHELLGHDDAADAGEEEAASGHGHGGCACGTVDPPGLPELDVRVIPHAIRHATIFGALDAVVVGGGIQLVADHDPIPLLNQVQQRTPGRFDISYLERGPVDYRLEFVRVS